MCQYICLDHRISPGDENDPLPRWIRALNSDVLQKTTGSGARLKGLGVVVSIAITAAAVFALTHALKKVDFDKVFEVVRNTNPSLIALALLLVAISYWSLTFYDLFALRTIGRNELPYRIAALASFTSYPIAHGIGAVALVAPLIRYRIYSRYGLSVLEVANISFLTGLTFWLGNLTALGLSVLWEPSSIDVIDFLPPQGNRAVALMLLAGVVAVVIWSWRSKRSAGFVRWPMRFPSGPMVLLQIALGILDLGATALAMYVLIPAEMHIGLFRAVAVFIAAILLGFASHAPAGLGAFDATILIGLGDQDSEESLIAALLIFRFLYHLLPFVLALLLFGGVEGWRSLRART
jgi:glycosyltransferase 2 family protein